MKRQYLLNTFALLMTGLAADKLVDGGHPVAGILTAAAVVAAIINSLLPVVPRNPGVNPPSDHQTL